MARIVPSLQLARTEDYCYTLHLHLHFHRSIENFSAYNILHAALFSAASPAERLRSAGSLAINTYNTHCSTSLIIQRKKEKKVLFHFTHAHTYICIYIKIVFISRANPVFKSKHKSYLFAVELRTVARKFSSRYNFFKFLLQSDNELLVSEMQKKIGGHQLRFRDKACGKLP